MQPGGRITEEVIVWLEIPYVGWTWMKKTP